MYFSMRICIGQPMPWLREKAVRRSYFEFWRFPECVCRCTTTTVDDAERTATANVTEACGCTKTIPLLVSNFGDFRSVSSLDDKLQHAVERNYKQLYYVGIHVCMHA